MSTKPNTHAFQDLPPKGGYPGIQFKRGIRSRGPSGLAIWLAVLTCSAYGFYKIGQTGQRNRQLRKEKREARMATLSFLQAEKDHELSERIDIALKKEAEIMKDIKDWKVGESVYSQRKIDPVFRNRFV